MNWITKSLIKYIVWDFDGTLYQNEQLGAIIKNFYFKILKQTKPRLTSLQFDNYSTKYGSWASAVCHFTDYSEFELLDLCDKKIYRPKYLKHDPAIVTLIEKKLSNYHHLILTNSNSEQVKVGLKKIGFSSKTFEVIFSRDSMKLIKPDPKVYSIIQHHTLTPKFRHLFIGDSISHDITPAKKNGFPAIPIWEIDQHFNIH